MHLEEDPFFNVSYIVDIHNKNGVIPVFFSFMSVLEVSMTGYSFIIRTTESKDFYRTLIVGFHPSYSVDLNIKTHSREKAVGKFDQSEGSDE